MKTISLRTKLILTFSIVILVGVLLSVITGIRLIGNTIIRQAQDKVRLDLNSAREIYQTECLKIKDCVRLTASRFFIKNAILQEENVILAKELHKIRMNENLDILTLTDPGGNVILRSRNPINREKWTNNKLIERVIKKKIDVVSTILVSSEDLAKEDAILSEKARIRLIPTQKARSRSTSEETSGMLIEAASPVFGYKNELIGILYGGDLLNRNYEIVDKVKDIVYRGERHREKDIGTATIFQDDLRISTNVKQIDGKRAIGTRVSKEVYDQVIGKGIPWVGRAFVVNDWYITAYEPIKTIKGEIIGMLYVGMLEAPYIELKKRVLLTFVLIAFLSVILLTVIAWFTSSSIVKPLKKLLFATKKIGEGNLSHRVQIKTKGEIGQLADSFNQMTVELQNATEMYLSLNRTLEDKVIEKTRELENTRDQLIQSEKLSSLGKLAAGIAHEINNPLTTILINSHSIQEELTENSRFEENLKLIIDETTRCSKIVKSLLEFSRQNPPAKKSANINNVIDRILLLLKSQILVQKVRIENNLDKNLPRIMIDINKIEQVFTNIILNALDAMPGGGQLSIVTQLSADNQYVLIKFSDNGTGIQDEVKRKIFDPFFTTKKTEGTGLGLSISYGIIQLHGGTIEVESKPNKGSTFTIYLPVDMK